MVSYNGSWFFPTYTDVKTGDMFGLDYGYEVNYRELKTHFSQQEEGNWY